MPLVLYVLLPLLSAAVPLRDVAQTPAAREMAPVQVEAFASIHPSPTPASTGLFRQRSRIFSPSPILTMLTLACYGIFLVYHGTRLWRAERRTKALLSSARNREIPERLALIVERCQRAFGLKSVTILYSAETSVPITVGRRTKPLPKALFDSDSPDLLSAAVGHEMAHIKRGDFAFNLIYELLSLPLAFHAAIRSGRKMSIQLQIEEKPGYIKARFIDAGAPEEVERQFKMNMILHIQSFRGERIACNLLAA